MNWPRCHWARLVLVWGYFTGEGRGRWLYPGATTELGFANGMKVTYTNFAESSHPIYRHHE